MDQQQRYSYLKALRIPVWVHQQSVVADLNVNPAPNKVSAQAVEKPIQSTTPSQPEQQYSPTPKQERSNSKISSMLKELERKPSTANSSSEQPASGIRISAKDVSQLDWKTLRHNVTECRQCSLADYRGQTVFGAGDTSANWMIIGEAPGADEDRQGQPFVGRAGQLLNNMLRAIDLPRQSVYIANILKCRPPNNRDPRPEEAAHCMGYLHRQIALVNPAIILVVGRIAAQNLLQSKETLGRLRNTTHYLADTKTPVIVTYHPAYLLRQPLEKRKAWEDLKRARSIANTIIE
ncbi:MAG: Uracil-DNA glycosylase, family 4 [uncultured Thiotrichaceae bacterium]|uniref:Type-4 uracil-DNA glycosylase n=1 Tax=uncultured Thiotrichaceae bacterium TaxID=298394 RepID=A0A6S6TEJ7_9GAMM|nr:MAG: Uracil-DNA glycosylase, family 4 [uncultured Thiotrichaceae bacterium]